MLVNSYNPLFMVLTEEKIKAVKKKLSKGLPEGEIKNELRAEGYTEDDINRIFAPQPYDMRSWYLFFGILISLFGFYIMMQQGSLLILILGMVLLSLYYKLHIQERNKKEKLDP